MKESLAVSLNVTPDQLNQHCPSPLALVSPSGYEPPDVLCYSVLTIKYLQPLQIIKEMISQEAHNLATCETWISGGHSRPLCTIP